MKSRGSSTTLQLTIVSTVALVKRASADCCRMSAWACREASTKLGTLGTENDTEAVPVDGGMGKTGSAHDRGGIEEERSERWERDVRGPRGDEWVGEIVVAGRSEAGVDIELVRAPRPEHGQQRIQLA